MGITTAGCPLFWGKVIITREQQELMTLSRSPDQSYEVMLDALMIAIEYIRQNDR